MSGKLLLKYFFTLLLAVAFSVKVFAAKTSIKIPIQFTIENGDFKQSTVSVKKNGETVYTLPGQRNSSLSLEYGNEYLLQFNKPGYISKSIRVNTTVPIDRGVSGFDPYKIGVRLFKQYEGVNIVVYNQPVAFIRYQNDLDEFGYDVDYTKSILSILNIAEEALAQKAAEERASLKNSGIKIRDFDNDGNENVKTEVTIRQSQEVKRVPSRVTVGISAPTTPLSPSDFPMEKTTIAAENKIIASPSVTPANNFPIVAAGINQGSQIKPQSGDELSAGMNPQSGDGKSEVSRPTNGDELPNLVEVISSGNDHPTLSDPEFSLPFMTTEKIIESNRVITIFHISDGTQKVDIKKVNYNWGGVFYFKDNSASISENLFQWYIKGK